MHSLWSTTSHTTILSISMGQSMLPPIKSKTKFIGRLFLLSSKDLMFSKEHMELYEGIGYQTTATEILAYISSALSTPSCGLYGAPPCQFVPAPPGQTPACARPGRTYCEHVDNYPTYLIKHLVHKWGYEAKNLLVDETWDEFAALAWHETPIFYDPAFIFPGGGGGGGAHGSDFGGYKYNTPGSHGAGPQGAAESTYIITKQQTTEPPTFLLYTGSGQRLNKNQVGYSGGGHKVSPNNPTFWLKRIVRDIGLMGQTVSSANHTTAATDTPSSESSSSRSTRDVSLNMDLLDIVGAEKGPKARTKRQSPGRSTLCQTTSQFITPQAALNSKGNWMFVVNEASTARQMVKAELCASNTCSNLCQLPSGYNSRCEQKFVQKRLIALQASGQNLYTDTFWFPSCCVCTLSTN